MFHRFRPWALPLAGAILMTGGLALWLLAPELDRGLLIAGRFGGTANMAAPLILFTKLGAFVVLGPLAAAVAAILLIRGEAQRALWFILTVGTGRIATEAAKLLIQRDRPPIAGRLDLISSHSFPSGHSAGTMLTWAALAMLLSRRWPGIIPFAALMAIAIGWSRIALGVHWPSDVLGGFGLALLWAGAAHHWLPEERGRPISRA